MSEKTAQPPVFTVETIKAKMGSKDVFIHPMPQEEQRKRQFSNCLLFVLLALFVFTLGCFAVYTAMSMSAIRRGETEPSTAKPFIMEEPIRPNDVIFKPLEERKDQPSSRPPTSMVDDVLDIMKKMEEGFPPIPKSEEGKPPVRISIETWKFVPLPKKSGEESLEKPEKNPIPDVIDEFIRPTFFPRPSFPRTASPRPIFIRPSPQPTHSPDIIITPISPTPPSDKKTEPIAEKKEDKKDSKEDISDFFTDIFPNIFDTVQKMFDDPIIPRLETVETKDMKKNNTNNGRFVETFGPLLISFDPPMRQPNVDVFKKEDRKELDRTQEPKRLRMSPPHMGFPAFPPIFSHVHDLLRKHQEEPTKKPEPIRTPQFFDFPDMTSFFDDVPVLLNPFEDEPSPQAPKTPKKFNEILDGEKKHLQKNSEVEKGQKSPQSFDSQPQNKTKDQLNN